MALDAHQPIRIVIADDEPHFRRGVRLALQSSAAHIEVVAEAADGQDAIERARAEQPDVMVLDVHMPRADGLAAARAIRAFAPRIRILMLTVSDSTEDIAAAMKAGASGYLLKERSLEEIAGAVVSLAEGRSWPVAG